MKRIVAVPVNYGMLSYQLQLLHLVDGDCRSPRQLWNALLPSKFSITQQYNWSQSPSIMECSPTLLKINIIKQKQVAVPVNYGMLSYEFKGLGQQLDNGRSPRQLWNALLRSDHKHYVCSKRSQSPSIMECSPTLLLAKVVNLSYCRSPRQLWNALLLGDMWAKSRTVVSQSPSIMECSPTTQNLKKEKCQQGRSPRQLWNALLLAWIKFPDPRLLSQSPSIMECSPTNAKKTKMHKVCRSPRQLWNALLLALSGIEAGNNFVAVPVNYGMLSYTSTSYPDNNVKTSQSPSIMECSPT